MQFLLKSADFNSSFVFKYIVNDDDDDTSFWGFYYMLRVWNKEIVTMSWRNESHLVFCQINSLSLFDWFGQLVTIRYSFYIYFFIRLRVLRYFLNGRLSVVVHFGIARAARKFSVKKVKKWRKKKKKNTRLLRKHCPQKLFPCHADNCLING